MNVSKETLDTMYAALCQVRMGLTNPNNTCWPTVKRWTKKERDETMLHVVRVALREYEADRELSERLARENA